MKKVAFFLIFMLCLGWQCALADNAEPDLADSLHVAYWNGPPMPPDREIFFDWHYEYKTEDPCQINKVTECLKSFEMEELTEYGRASDTEKLFLYFDDTSVEFDMMTNVCMVDDTVAYSFQKEDYDRLCNLIFDLRTENFVKIYVNSQRVKSDKVILSYGRTLAAAHQIADALSINPTWNDKENAITFESDGISVSFLAGANMMIQNGQQISLDVGAEVVNQYVMVPVRALAESFGFNVSWIDGEVIIEK